MRQRDEFAIFEDAASARFARISPVLVLVVSSSIGIAGMFLFGDDASTGGYVFLLLFAWAVPNLHSLHGRVRSLTLRLNKLESTLQQNESAQ